MNIKLAPPKVMELKPRITVIGIGGAGCNAINNMIATQLKGVEFIVANTDAQSLSMSNAERRIQLGANLTEGLGAGARPEVGEAAAREAEEDVRAEIAGSHMVFIAAGMGGGTGTGAAAVIAEIARDLGILTVGIVSKPFQFEGARRMRTADAGIAALEKVVDTLIVIPNQNLFRIANERTTFAEAFRLADQVLYSGIACIVDLIVKEGLINLDFADVQAVMKGMGTAMMGTGEATGEDRAMVAANEAIANPLLDNVSLAGAQGLLISIVGGSDLTLYEVDTAASHIRKEVAVDANIIVGATTEPGMEDRIRVSIVASGMTQSGQAAGGISTSSPRPQEPANRQTIQPSRMMEQSATIGSLATNSVPQVGGNSGASSVGLEGTATEPTQGAAKTSPFGAGHQGQQTARTAPEAAIQKTAEAHSDDDMGPEEADAFARALSEAMDAVGTRPRNMQHDGGHGGAVDDADYTAAPVNAPQGGTLNSWQSADGVLVEEGLVDRQSVQHPPPLPHRSAARPSNPDTAGFEPAPPVQVPRTIPRIPKLSDFPEVAQREYFAKMDAARQDTPSNGQDDQRDPYAPEPQSPHQRPQTQPRSRPASEAEASNYTDVTGRKVAENRADHAPAARPGLFSRLTGGGRK